MTPTSAGHKRSIQNVLINRPMQREFTLVMLAIMMTAACAVGVLIHFSLKGLTEDAPSTISRLALEFLKRASDLQSIECKKENAKKKWGVRMGFSRGEGKELQIFFIN